MVLCEDEGHSDPQKLEAAPLGGRFFWRVRTAVARPRLPPPDYTTIDRPTRLDAARHNGARTVSGGLRSVFLPLPSLSWVILAGTVIYMGLTVWIWSHWRKLRIRQTGIPRWGAADRVEYHQAAGATSTNVAKDSFLMSAFGGVRPKIAAVQPDPWTPFRQSQIPAV